MTETPDPRTLLRSDFAMTWPITTRWADNDMFGHLNNAVYYQLFDTAINGWIETTLGIDPMTATSRPVVAASGCQYFREVAFPAALTVAFRVGRMGRTSVSYELGLFRDGDEDGPTLAFGTWVHVYVDSETGRPVPVPDEVRTLHPA